MRDNMNPTIATPKARAILVAAISAIALVAETASVFAGEVVRGPVRVCKKPMLAGSLAFSSLIKPGPDAWTKLAERQADEAKYCYIAGDIELIEKGPELDAGLSTKCTEWRAKARDDEVYVVIGSRDRAWGRCP